MSTTYFELSSNSLKKWVQKHKTSVILIIVLAPIVILTFVYLRHFVPKNLWEPDVKWLQLILTLISIGVAILVPLVLARHRAKRETGEKLVEHYPLGPLESLSIEELRKKKLPQPTEEYIRDPKRKELEKIKSTIRTKPKPRYILIYGPQGVGKSREAIEIIEKLERSELEERTIYFIQSFGFPTGEIRVKSNVVLMFDDLRPSKGLPTKVPYGEKLLPSFDEFLEMIIDFFDKETDLNCVIITMLTEEYSKLKELSPSLFDKFGTKFIPIELAEFSFPSRRRYINEVADLFELDIPESLVEKFAEIRVPESLKGIRAYLFEKSYEKRKEHKRELGLADFEEYKKMAMELKEELLARYPQERLMFDVLSKFHQFSIPTFTDAVKALWCAKVDGGFLKGRKFKKTLKKIVEKYEGERIRVEGNSITCPNDFWLSLKSANDPSLEEDLKELAESLRPSKKKMQYENYLLFTPLSHELHRYGMYEEAIEFYDYILGLPEYLLPQDLNLQKTKSKFLFYKGHAYYSLGRKYWDEAENCYVESLKLSKVNLFAKHAYATLLYNNGYSSKALRLLGEIAEANKKDLLAYKTKLDIYIDIGDIGSQEARQTIKEIEDLLRSNISFPQKLIFSAKLTLTRFLEKKGEILKGGSEEAEEYFDNVVIPEYESLIEEIPSELNDLKSVVKNAYGCFLYDVREKREDGVAQLEGAHDMCPEHKRTLHKLVSVYIKKGEAAPQEKDDYFQKANSYLRELLGIDPECPQALLFKAELEGKSVNWEKLAEYIRLGKLAKSNFWEKVLGVFKIYENALEEVDREHSSLHNMIVHHNTGWFLWSVEMKAKDFVQSKNPLIPFADVEFRKSIQIEEYYKNRIFPREVEKHLIIAYGSLSSYLVMAGRFRKDRDMIQKGYFYANKAFKLSKRWKIEFHSNNSYIESYLGKRLLDDGKSEEAIDRFRRALAITPNNLFALEGLKDYYIKKENHERALKHLERYAKIVNRPSKYGILRNTAKRWMKQRKIPQDMHLLRSYSKKAYALDPNGDLDPRNISDYAYDTLRVGKIEGDETMLMGGKKLFTHLIDRTLDRIDENPDNEELYLLVMRSYSPPIWKSGQKLDEDITLKIEECAERHSKNSLANKMAGIVLQRNGECNKAVHYLEKQKASKDTFVLKSLMECYEVLGKRKKAEKIARELARALLARKKRIESSF